MDTTIPGRPESGPQPAPSLPLDPGMLHMYHNPGTHTPIGQRGMAFAGPSQLPHTQRPKFGDLPAPIPGIKAVDSTPGVSGPGNPDHVRENQNNDVAYQNFLFHQRNLNSQHTLCNADYAAICQKKDECHNRHCKELYTEIKDLSVQVSKLEVR